MVPGSARYWIAVNAVNNPTSTKEKTENMTTPSLTSSISLSPWQRVVLLIALVLACFAFLQNVQAVSPAPDGAYGGNNTAEGANALFDLTTGIENTAIGSAALYNNTTGNYNTATGSRTLLMNTTGVHNTGYGRNALFSNTSGIENTASGWDALFSNTTGNDNTATGSAALYNNTTGFFNTADGYQVLLSNTTGTQNTATGESALKSNTTASNNTADGFQVLFHNTTGAGNTAVGFHALSNNNGSSNIALGLSAGVNLTTGSNNIDIGSFGAGGESNTIRIGSAQVRTFIKGISGVGVTGIAVVVNSSGQLGTAPSSQRFKAEIKPMDKTSEAILALKPVTFRYKHELDPNGIPQFGLVAEEVEKVNAALITRDADGKPYTVRYDAVNAMLLNEFLKEHRKVEEQGATIAKQQKQIEALTAGLQKVSAQVEASKPAPQTVLNNQ
jgi:hypothetical protein